MTLCGLTLAPAFIKYSIVSTETPIRCPSYFLFSSRGVSDVDGCRHLTYVDLELAHRALPDIYGPGTPFSVSDQPSHLEQSRDISQDRVHVNHRGHHAQRFTDTERCNAANPPDLYPPVQGPIGCGLPAAWRIHCSAGPGPWDERQCVASLAQGACAQQLSPNNAARPSGRCPHEHANTRIPARTAATPATCAGHAADAPCDQD